MINGKGSCKLCPSNLRRVPFLWMLIWLIFHHHHLDFCFSLNREGLALLGFKDRLARDPFNALSSWNRDDADANPCSWFGIHCSDGAVVSLTLKDLCLGGALAPELGELAHVKSIILRNNSFYGSIPREIVELEELEVLDLGYNNFTGPLPLELGNNLSLGILLLDNNNFLGCVSEHCKSMLSEYQVDETQLRSTTGVACNNKFFSWNTNHQPLNFVQRRMLRAELPEENKTMHNGKVFASSPASPTSHQSPRAGEKKGNNSASAPVPSLASPPSRSPSKSNPLPPSLSESPADLPRSSRKLPPFSSLSPSTSSLPSPLLSPSSSPSPSPLPSSLLSPTPSIYQTSPSPAPSLSSNSTPETFSASNSSHKVLIWTSVAGASLFVIVTAFVIFICQRCKVVTVKPWATGLSGQLQKAFISGIPKLKRAELETACEDFSNIIGSLADSIVYKGTLSSGVEIAVVSSLVKSRKQWSENLEVQFRKKVEILSKVNHMNFVNLIGYCEEEKPFTRMMVFEYAPSGTLFEHLHIKEAERLDWRMRLRIIMGMAYCLEHMHQLSPPVPHRNLQSSSVYLTEDYAAKVSDFSFWNEVTAAKMRSPSMQLLEASVTDTESNVHSFGIILFEVITGRIPYAADNGSVEDWVWDYLRVDELPEEITDPTLSAFREEEVQKLFGIVKDCVHPDPKERPAMREVTSRLKEITAIKPDGAAPRLSPLWWAELEILSTEGA